MRIQAIIRLLSDKEIKLINSIIVNRNRETLLNLWNAAKSANSNEDWGKENLFKKTYGYTYAKEKDYLFRNEQRILNTILLDFIAKIDVQNEMEQRQSLNTIKVLERMLKTSKVEDFENLWNEAFRSANDIADYEVLSKLMELKSNWLTKFHEISVKNYMAIANAIESEKQYLEKYFQERSHRLEVGKSFAKKVIKALSPEDYKVLKLQKPTKEKDVFFEGILTYYTKMSESYLLDGEDKIKLLHELLTLYPKVVKSRVDLKKDITTLYGNLGLEYFLMSDFNNADKTYRKVLSLQSATEMNIEVLFNYCVNLLMLSRYKEFTIQYNLHLTAIDNNEKLKHRFLYFNTIALLFENKAEKAFQLLTQDISQRPVHDYYYFRTIYAMVYFQLKDTDNALREVENILQSFRFRKNAHTVDKPLVKLIHRLITAYTISEQKTKFKAKLDKIKKELQAQSSNKQNTSTVIYRWIEWQVALLLKTKK